MLNKRLLSVCVLSAMVTGQAVAQTSTATPILPDSGNQVATNTIPATTPVIDDKADPNQSATCNEISQAHADVLQSEMDVIMGETTVSEYVDHLQTANNGSLHSCMAGLRDVIDLSDAIPVVTGIGSAAGLNQALRNLGKQALEQAKKQMLNQACDIATNVAYQATSGIRRQLDILNRLNEAVQNPDKTIGGYTAVQMGKITSKMDGYLESHGAKLSEKIRQQNLQLEQSTREANRTIQDISRQAEEYSKEFDEALPTPTPTNNSATPASVVQSAPAQTQQAQQSVAKPVTSTTAPINTTAPNTGSNPINTPQPGFGTNPAPVTNQAGNQTQNSGVISNSSSARPLS